MWPLCFLRGKKSSRSTCIKEEKPKSQNNQTNKTREREYMWEVKKKMNVFRPGLGEKKKEGEKIKKKKERGKKSGTPTQEMEEELDVRAHFPSLGIPLVGSFGLLSSSVLLLPASSAWIQSWTKLFSIPKEEIWIVIIAGTNASAKEKMT